MWTLSCQDVFSTFAEENVYKPEEDNVDMCHRKINNDKHVKGVDGGVCAVGSADIFLELLMKGLCVHMLTESSRSCCFDTLRQVPNCSPGAFQPLFSRLIPLSLFFSCSWFGNTLVWVSWIPWIGLEFLTYINFHFLNYRFGSIQVVLILIGIFSF